MTEGAGAGIRLDRCHLDGVALSQAIAQLTDAAASGGMGCALPPESQTELEMKFWQSEVGHIRPHTVAPFY